MKQAAKTTLSNTGLAAARGLTEAWNQALVAHDWTTLLLMCTDDVVFQPPGEPPVSGAAARHWLKAMPAVQAITWEIDFAEAGGNLAVLRGPVEMTLDRDGRTTEFRGKYCHNLRKERDGVWRFSCLTWNSNQHSGREERGPLDESSDEQARPSEHYGGTTAILRLRLP